MGKVSISKPGDRTFFRAGDRVADSDKQRHLEGELRSQVSTYFPIDGEPLQLFEVRFGPGDSAQSHAHSEDEIFVIIEGEMVVGNQVLPKGTAVYVEKETLYSFRSGPEGCTFLNFRPASGAQYITRSDLAARRRSAGS